MTPKSLFPEQNALLSTTPHIQLYTEVPNICHAHFSKLTCIKNFSYFPTPAFPSLKPLSLLCCHLPCLSKEQHNPIDYSSLKPINHFLFSIPFVTILTSCHSTALFKSIFFSASTRFSSLSFFSVDNTSVLSTIISRF